MPALCECPRTQGQVFEGDSHPTVGRGNDTDPGKQRKVVICHVFIIAAKEYRAEKGSECVVVGGWLYLLQVSRDLNGVSEQDMGHFGAEYFRQKEQ